ncbi:MULTISPECIES: hypothetical protein [Cupriavidus]
MATTGINAVSEMIPYPAGYLQEKDRYAFRYKHEFRLQTATRDNEVALIANLIDLCKSFGSHACIKNG